MKRFQIITQPKVKSIKICIFPAETVQLSLKKLLRKEKNGNKETAWPSGLERWI